MASIPDKIPTRPFVPTHIPSSQSKSSKKLFHQIIHDNENRTHFSAETLKNNLKERIKFTQGNRKDIAKLEKAIKKISSLEKKEIAILKKGIQKRKNSLEASEFTENCHAKYLKKISKEFDSVSLKTKSLQMAYREQMFSGKENRGFKPIENTIVIGGHQATSSIIPVNKAKGTFIPKLENHQMYTALEVKHAPGMVNFHESSYSVDGNTLFRSSRSGVISSEPKHIKLSPEEMQLPEKKRKKLQKERAQEINQARAKQLLTFGVSRFLTQPENQKYIDQIRAELAKNPHLKEFNLPVPFHHNSLSLVSLIHKERKMAMDELRALKSLEGKQPFTFEIDGKQVTVNAYVQVHFANMACSPYYYSNFSNIHISTFKSLVYAISGTLGQFFAKHNLGLGSQSRFNKVAWRDLNQRFNVFEKTFEKMSHDKNFTTEERNGFQKRLEWAKLVHSQLSDLGGLDAYTTRAVSNPVAVQARLVALTNLMGENTHWNCKSGKDRTGIVDIELKYLMHHLATEGSLPPMGSHLKTEKQRELRSTIALESGNVEIPWINTADSMKNVKKTQTGHLFGKRVTHLLTSYK